MPRIRKQRPTGIEVIEATKSKIFWDSIQRRFLYGRENRLCVKVECGRCQKQRWVAIHNLDKRNKLFTGCCDPCQRHLPWEQKRRFKPAHRRPTGEGYIKIFLPDNPMADKRGEVYEHRLIASQMIGRPLTHFEHVHHKDGNKLNNQPENLEIVPSNEHILITKLLNRINFLESILKKHHILIPK